MENKSTLGDFGGLSDILIGGKDSDNSIMNMEDDNTSLIDPDDLKKQLESLDENEVDSSESTVIDDKESIKSKSKETTSDLDTEVKEKEQQLDKKEDDTNEVEISDDDLPTVVEFFSDKFAEELGWEFDENEKPKSVEELVKYMQNIIDNNSQPRYSNDEIRELDEFVSNGGNLRDYFNRTYASEVNLDNIDLGKEPNQKAVIRENLRIKGYSENRIEKLISRYEETDTLEEEAKDSLEEVKEAKAKARTDLLEQQRLQVLEEEKQRKTFVSNVEDIIKSTNDVRGIKVPDADKKMLMEYIFKPINNGMSQYQIDYNKDLKNLVESAYFTMKGDKFQQQLEKKAATTATKKLTLKLKATGKSTKNTTSDMDNGGKISKLWDIASSAIVTNNN